MSPTLQPQSAISVLKPVKKKKVAKTGRPAGQVSFPIDYFEHSQHTNDIEVNVLFFLQKKQTKLILFRRLLGFIVTKLQTKTDAVHAYVLSHYSSVEMMSFKCTTAPK